MISSINIPDPTIIFECSDTRRDTGLLLLKRKDSKFELHLHNDYTNQALAMVLSINDFAKMFESLEEYFERADRNMTSIVTTKKKEFTISLTKTELDAIQKKLIGEYGRMLDRVRRINSSVPSSPSPSNSEKSYRYDNESDNVTVTLSIINKINNNKYNKFNNIRNRVIVNVTLTYVLSLRFLF